MATILRQKNNELICIKYNMRAHFGHYQSKTKVKILIFLQIKL